MRRNLLPATLPTQWVVLFLALALFGAPGSAHAQRRCRTCYTVTSSCCNELHKCRQRVVELQNRVATLEQSLACCVEEKRQLASDLAKTATERDQLRDKVHALVHRLKKYETQLEEARAELRKLQAELDACKCHLEQAHAEITDLKDKLDECETARKAALDEVASLTASLKACADKLHDAELRLVALQHDLDHEKSQTARLGHWVLLLIVLVFLLLLLWLLTMAYFWHQSAKLTEANNAAQRQHEHDVARITDLSGQCSGAQSQAAQMQRRIDELSRENMQLTSWLNECRSAKAFAEQQAAVAGERALGAVREMAANKKDCCCCCGGQSGPVIAPTVTIPNGPVTTTPSTPTTTSPVGGGTPGATAAGGPAGPTAATAAGGPAGPTAGPSAAPAVGVSGNAPAPALAPVATDTVAQQSPPPTVSSSPIGAPGNIAAPAPNAPAPNATPSGLTSNSSTSSATDSEAQADSSATATSL